MDLYRTACSGCCRSGAEGAGGGGLKSADCRPTNRRLAAARGSPVSGLPTSMPQMVAVDHVCGEKYTNRVKNPRVWWANSTERGDAGLLRGMKWTLGGSWICSTRLNGMDGIYPRVGCNIFNIWAGIIYVILFLRWKYISSSFLIFGNPYRTVFLPPLIGSTRRFCALG